MAQGSLGVLFNDLRGKAGGVVFTHSKDGTVVKPRTIPTNPQTPAQVAVRDKLTVAARTYRGLTLAQAAPWKAYALTLTRRDRRTGKSHHPTPLAAFNALAAKFLQINPHGTIPLVPPTTPFTGDTVTITAANEGDGITFTASAANATHVKTELLLQPLASPHRTPAKNGYRTQRFVAFATGSLTFAINVPDGWYAPAYRFVNAQTGQDMGLVPLPLVQVG
jgi:hypothetical protein